MSSALLRSIAETVRSRLGLTLGLLGVLILFGLALLGLATGWDEVKPITGLTTFGGAMGGISAVIAYNVARRWPCSRATIVAVLEGYFLIQPGRVIYILGYATFGGYVYAKVMWNLGARVLGRDGYVVGRIIWPVPALANALIALGIVVGVILLVRRLQGVRVRAIPRDQFVGYVSAAVAYCAWLFLATGLAGMVWFPLFGVSA